MSPTPRTVALSPNDARTAAARFLIHWVNSKGNFFDAADEAEQHSRHVPSVAYTFRQFNTKGAVGAQALGATDPYAIGPSFFALLQSASILGRLSPLCRRVPFRTRTPADVAGGTFNWRSPDGTPAALTRDTTAQIQQEVFVGDYTVVVSKELFRFGAVAEALLADLVTKGLARGLDGQFLDRTVGPSTSHPASVFF
jgi:hypothetical protein